MGTIGDVFVLWIVKKKGYACVDDCRFVFCKIVQATGFVCCVRERKKNDCLLGKLYCAIEVAT